MVGRQGGRSVRAARNEHTIAVSCRVSGKGYWTGKHVNVDILPAAAGTGIQLVRTDLPSHPSAPANVSHRTDAHLRTIIQSGDGRFEMIEHVMAALYALEIDNCIVQIDGKEFPGLDGSAKAYVGALSNCGLIIQAKARERVVVTQPIRIEAGSGWIEATPSVNGLSRFEYQLDFDSDTPINSQTFSIELTPDRFRQEVAAARTFVTLEQAQTLRAQGVASHVTNQDLLVFGDDGPLDNELRFQNECARHKVLDMVGDFALAGVEIIGNIVSYRGGHNLNGRMTSKLHELLNEQKTNQVNSHRRAA